MTITGRTKIVGVWGHPVGHSRSPAMHNAALAALGLDWAYVPFDVAPERLSAAVGGLRALNLVGVNVTVPHKEAVLPLLDVVDEEARRVGSVNTIHNVGGVLHGFSTDGPGFLRSLEALGERAEGRSALILGAGGSARAVAFALAGRGGRVQIANRTEARAQALADRLNTFHPGAASVAGWGAEADAFDLLVNATSLGMDPRPDALPALPPGTFGPGILVYDLVYSPLETRLLALARRAGCRAVNGLPMLTAQGALSLARWTGVAWECLPLGIMEQAALAGGPG
ncbi:MAG: shikimate dehydrogenase [Armatimonadetes bacterium]|nr:shikimate dehydrogenase [Armatimonadota bacterium]